MTEFDNDRFAGIPAGATIRQQTDIEIAWSLVNQIIAQGRGVEIHVRRHDSYFVRADSMEQEGYWFLSLQCEDETLLKAMENLKALCDCQKGRPTWGAR